MSPSFSRRTLLKGAGLMAASAAVPASLKALAATTPELTAQFDKNNLMLPGAAPTRVMTYEQGHMPPILRARQGKPFSFRLVNRLPEPTTIHSHGIRLPNEMDGVPFLTQAALYEDDSFTYSFTPPDAGTFWYHPHCNSLEQIGYGLAGALIVDEAKDPGFDDDITLVMRDWRLRSDGNYLPFYKARSSARAGTFGTIRTSNWQQAPLYDVPSGGLVRLRLIAADVTRIYSIASPQMKAMIIAVDGNPVSSPSLLETMRIGPGQRLDLAIQIPQEEGTTAKIISHSGSGAFAVARLRANGASLKRHIRDTPQLPANPVQDIDPKTAEPVLMEFSASAEKAPANIICGSIGYTFWAINQAAWRGSTANPTEPMMTFKLGKSYRITLINRTPHTHPVHLHGMSFRLLNSNKRQIPNYVTDTALLLPDERMDIGLVADNPGDWLLHCHILEHQKSGMSSFVRVE
ncbi:multicopper oxidase family protein [Coralliovum pocilloporae]|uniref:multicopper oxidase family protein n=1 Tax=Coralliovum pocilloporae TaxID=3066369 RepID=UPI0033077454